MIAGNSVSNNGTHLASDNEQDHRLIGDKFTVGSQNTEQITSVQEHVTKRVQTEESTSVSSKWESKNTDSNSQISEHRHGKSSTLPTSTVKAGTSKDRSASESNRISVGSTSSYKNTVNGSHDTVGEKKKTRHGSVSKPLKRGKSNCTLS